MTAVRRKRCVVLRALHFCQISNAAFSQSAPSITSTRIQSVAPFADAIERAACALSNFKLCFCPYPNCPAETLVERRLGDYSISTDRMTSVFTPIRVTHWPRPGAVSGEESAIVVLTGTIQFNSTDKCVLKIRVPRLEGDATRDTIALKKVPRYGSEGKRRRRVTRSRPRPTPTSSRPHIRPTLSSGREVGPHWSPR